MTTTAFPGLGFLPYTGSCCQQSCPVNKKQVLQQKFQVGVGACLVRGIIAKPAMGFEDFSCPRGTGNITTRQPPPLPTPMRCSRLSCQASLLSAVSRASGCQRRDFIPGSLRPYRKTKMFIYVSYCLAKSLCA